MISYSRYELDARVHRYAESLVHRGDSVDIIGLGVRGQPREENVHGVQVHRLQTRDFDHKNAVSYLAGMVAFFMRSMWTCTLLHIKHRYDVLHFHNIPDFGVFCTWIPKWMGAAVILDVHDLVPEFYMRKFGITEDHPVVRALKWCEKRSAQFADHVITVTSIWKETLTGRSVEESKCSVMLNSPTGNLFYPRPKPERKKSTLHMVYHGNLSEIFGVDLAIRAMPTVASRIPGAELHVYGPGKTNVLELEKLAEELGVKSHVHFHAPVPRTQVPQILSKADMGIDPKRDGVLAGEGLSNKCMEYFAMGVPAVVSSIKAARTYYHDDMVAFFRPGDPDDLAKRIVELWNDTKRRNAQKIHALQFIEKHGWHEYEKEYFRLLDRLVGHG